MPHGLVAMATESSHRLIMQKWLNCIFSITSEVMFGCFDHLMIVYRLNVFYDQWPFRLVATIVMGYYYDIPSGVSPSVCMCVHLHHFRPIT